jgi:hypothetical protein
MQTPALKTENKVSKSAQTKDSFFGKGETMPFFQAKLTVNEPGDKYEQEADRVADQVVNGQSGKVQAQSLGLPSISRLQRKPVSPFAVQRMSAGGEKEEEEPVQRMSAEGNKEEEEPVQRMSAGDEKEEGEPVQRMSAGDEKEEGEPVQRMSAGDEKEEEEPVQRMSAEDEKEEEEPVQRMSAGDEKEEEEPVQRKETAALVQKNRSLLKDKKTEIVGKKEKQDARNELQTGATREAFSKKTPISPLKPLKINETEEKVQMKAVGAVPMPGNFFGKKLNGTKGGGTPLQADVRPQMEYGFGADFGSIRIHTDSKATELNREINARAFTHGTDIYFNSGQYDPASAQGKKLLAHELTHVVQQNEWIRQTPTVAESVSESESSPASQPAVPEAAPDAALEPAEKLPPADSAAGLETNFRETPQPPEEEPVDNVGVSPELLTEDQLPLPPSPNVQPEAGDPVDPLKMEGSADQMALGVAAATPSQMAVSYPTLGDNASAQIKNDNQELAKSVPDLQARSGGIEGQLSIQNPEIKSVESGLGDGKISADPGQLKAAPHVFDQPAPGNQAAKQEVRNKDDESFFLWLKNNFGSFMSRIQTSDPGADTSAGERPRMVLQGDSDPARTQNLQGDSDAEVKTQKDATADELKNHPGQSKIQPVKVEETMPVEIHTEVTEQIATEGSEGMQQYAEMALPKQFRQAADAKLSANLSPKMEGVQTDVTQAKTTRDTEKNQAVTESEEETTRLNEEADTEQKKTIQDNRTLIADKQRSGMEEANTEMGKFREESGVEKKKVDGGIVDRVRTDEKDAATELDKGETDAKAEKQAKEKEAADKKRELDSQNNSGGIWGWVKSKVKAAVKDLTDAIDGIFTALRKAVKTIIEKAKNAALKLIEAGRKWITEKIDGFRIWLKDKVNKYIGAYLPSLAKRINGAIDAVVDIAIAGVNAVADKLKKGVQYLADKLSKFIDRVLAKFQTALKRAIRIMGAILTADFVEALKIAIQTACEVIGIDSKPIFDFIGRVKNQLTQILKHPIQFIINVGKGIQGGLNRFFGNIKSHLIGGVIDWLTGSLGGAGITLPATWDAKGIFGLVAQILNLTYDSIRKKVVKALGPTGEKAVSTLEKSADAGGKLLNLLMKNDPAALWEEAKETAGNIKDMLISTVSEWLITTIIKQGILWLISLTNPASALARALKMLFDVVMFLIERATQIIDFVRSVYDSLAAIVSGQMDKIAKAVENALSRAIPLFIGLIASILGLGGITKAIKNVLKRIRKPIDKAVNKVVKKLAGWAKKAWKKMKGGAKKVKEKVVEWWKGVRPFTTHDGENHSLFFKKKSSNYELFVQSTPLALRQLIKQLSRDKKLTGERRKSIEELSTLYSDVESMITSLKLSKKNDSKNKIINQIDSKVSLIQKALIKTGVSSSPLPKTNVKFVSARNKKMVNAIPLSIIPGNTVGSEDQGSINIPGWDAIPDSAKNIWKRGHLLNANLHGPATPDNLIPIVTEINNNQKDYIENSAKKEVANGKVLKYTAIVTFYEHEAQKPYLKYFPASIFMSWAEVSKKGEDWEPTGNMQKSMRFSQQPPNFDIDPNNKRAGKPALNESSAGILFEKTKNVLELSVLKDIVAARRKNNNYFGFMMHSFFTVMDQYYITEKKLPGSTPFSDRYGGIIWRLINEKTIILNRADEKY